MKSSERLVNQVDQEKGGSGHNSVGDTVLCCPHQTLSKYHSNLEPANSAAENS